MNAREAIAVEVYRVPTRRRIAKKFKQVFSWLFLTPCEECHTIHSCFQGGKTVKHFRVTIFKGANVVFDRLVANVSESAIRTQCANMGHSQSDVYVVEVKV